LTGPEKAAAAGASPPAARLHRERWKGSLAMSIENIEERELTEGERKVLADDRERWAKLTTGSQLDELLAFGHGLLIRRRMAMNAAYVTKPEGRGYVEAFNRIMVKDGFYRDRPNSPEAKREESRTRTMFTAILWLHDPLDRLQILNELRASMSPDQRARLNSPITARQYVEKEIARRKAVKDGVEESTTTVRESKLTELKRKNAELERENGTLREKLARADGGSLFDLQQSSNDEIATVFAGHWSARRWREFRAKADVAFKAKEQKPAG
jgi:hypothetical protein